MNSLFKFLLQNKDKRIIRKAKFKRETIFLNEDGSLNFVSYGGPIEFSSFNLRRTAYEEAGCPKYLTVTITAEEIPIKETYSLQGDT